MALEFIIGYMAAGKSTYATQEATRQDILHIDTDTWIEQHCGISVVDIFATRGEHYFRKKEQECIDYIRTIDQAIISCGGGLPCYYDCILELKKMGTVYWLQTPLDIIIERLMNTNEMRPLRPRSSEEIIQHYQRRMVYYEMADERIIKF